jgi:hypothetical protein
VSEPDDGAPPPPSEPSPPEAPASEAPPLESPAPAASAPQAPAPTLDSGPILPAAYDENALREALGSAPRPRLESEPSPYGRVYDDDHDNAEPKAVKSRRKTIVISAIVMAVGISIAALIFLGHANASRFLLVCNADHVSAEQGRAFPPWGSHPISGTEWRAIALPPNAECKPKESEDQSTLAGWYLEILVDRASTALTARDLIEAIPKTGGGSGANPLDTVSAQLDQALLLARAPERRDQRKDIERLQGDVEYWRAAARARDAAAALADAAKQFEAAAALRPRHVDDASAWATFARKVADEIHAGPNGAPALPSAPPGETHPMAPPGVALPVEPAPAGSDAAAAAAPPDAGVPSGGVLL